MKTDKIRDSCDYLFLIFTLTLSLIMISSPEVWAVNATMINEIQDTLSNELIYEPSFPAFWLVFLLVLLCFFMFTMLKMREDRETVFFALSSLIICIMITLLFTSPLAFDYQINEKKLTVEEITWYDLTVTYNAGVTDHTTQIILIPADNQFRFALSVLFSGLTLFNGLYSIYILVNFHGGKYNR